MYLTYELLKNIMKRYPNSAPLVLTYYLNAPKYFVILKINYIFTLKISKANSVINTCLKLTLHL